MTCPDCRTPLAGAGLHGVGFAACPRCRGIWIGRDALHTLLGRATGWFAAQPTDPERTPPMDPPVDGYRAFAATR